MEYEQFEKTETKDKIRRTRTGSNGSGGVDAQIDLTYNLVYTITSVLFSLIYTLQLFVKSFYNPVFRIYTIGLVAIFALLMRIISVIQKKSSEEEVKTQRENEHGNSLSSYILTSSLDVQNGKDIRIYKMQGMIQIWYERMMEGIKRTFVSFSYFRGKCDGVISFLTQIFAGCVYIYVGLSALNGMISVGNILLYANSITKLTGEFNELIFVVYAILIKIEIMQKNHV